MVDAGVMQRPATSLLGFLAHSNNSLRGPSTACEACPSWGAQVRPTLSAGGDLGSVGVVGRNSKTEPFRTFDGQTCQLWIYPVTSESG